MICLYSCRIVLFGKSFASAGKQLPWRAARRPGGAAIGSALAPSGGGEAQRKISSNHMGTEFLWLRDKCLTSESWQEMMAINCFNARYITNVYSVYNVIKNQKKYKDAILWSFKTQSNTKISLKIAINRENQFRLIFSEEQFVFQVHLEEEDKTKTTIDADSWGCVQIHVA